MTVPSGTVDAKGRLTAFEDHTVTIPNATATTESAGLMSSTDKTAVDKIGDTSMGTTASTITGAIAEHSQEISDLNSKFFTEHWSVSGKSVAARYTTDYDFSAGVSGASLVGIIGFWIGGGGECCTVSVYMLSSTTVRYRILNTGTNVQTPNDINIICLYMRN